MSVTLIFHWKGSGLKVRRSEKEKELMKEGWGSSMSEEELDKCAYIERKVYEQDATHNLFVQRRAIDKIK